MQLPNTTKIVKTKDELQTVLDAGLEHIQAEMASFTKLIEPKVTDLGTYLSELIKEVLALNDTYEKLKKEVTELEGQKKFFEDLKAKLDLRDKDQNKREEGLLELHKVLENKRLMLEAKENSPKF